MISYRNLFHPAYKESYLGFFIDSKTSTEKLALPVTFEDIDIYYQPLQPPLVIIGIMLIRIIVVILAEFVQFKAYLQIKKENGLVTQVAKVYLIVLMVAGPYWLIYTTIIELIYPVHEVIGDWFCSGAIFIGYVIFFIQANHSFIVASLRYLFIVHEATVKSYGKEKVRRIFLILSIVLPILLILWEIPLFNEFDAMSFNNKCKGLDIKMILLETSTLSVAKRNFCDYGPFGETFNSGSLDTIRYISCILRTCVILFLNFNITEGILYYLIISHMIR